MCVHVCVCVCVCANVRNMCKYLYKHTIMHVADV